MDFENNKIDINKSLNDLKQKLNALDSLMHSSAKFGDFKKTDKSINEKYSRSNPFTKNKKTIYN
ncbi:hypothetical protein L3049_20190 [Labilibaculum sp. DW002]|uniref:Uncharacterized protein n=1 Tax=Paralabilibaculum antarcticum TaxID=2912572 RepID=A0ABT5VY30_9BACT|nr:hypothetical protein [Labilibaculum sp. DW002]MDE5420320.1 hypothetical protein [Labilibaculum sp. DW002]